MSKAAQGDGGSLKSIKGLHDSRDRGPDNTNIVNSIIINHHKHQLVFVVSSPCFGAGVILNTHTILCAWPDHIQIVQLKYEKTFVLVCKKIF